MNARLFRPSCLVLTLVLLAVPALAAAPAPPTRDDGAVAPTRELPPVTWLQITSEDGNCYVGLSAGDDGPIRMPFQKELLPAVLISTRHEGDRLVVTLASEKAELETEPIGQYDLGFGEAAKAELAGVKVGAASTWELRLLRATRSAFPGCCSCAPLKVQCCPNVGKCLGCSTCGQCCG